MIHNIFNYLCLLFLLKVINHDKDKHFKLQSYKVMVKKGWATSS